MPDREFLEYVAVSGLFLFAFATPLFQPWKTDIVIETKSSIKYIGIIFMAVMFTIIFDAMSDLFFPLPEVTPIFIFIIYILIVITKQDPYGMAEDRFVTHDNVREGRSKVNIPFSQIHWIQWQRKARFIKLSIMTDEGEFKSTHKLRDQVELKKRILAAGIQLIEEN